MRRQSRSAGTASFGWLDSRSGVGLSGKASSWMNDRFPAMAGPRYACGVDASVRRSAGALYIRLSGKHTGMSTIVWYPARLLHMVFDGEQIPANPLTWTAD
jgi:hypothetical protein